MTAAAACEVCGGLLGYGRLTNEGVCQGCEQHGAQWAHHQLVRLWNAGLDRNEIADELGYTPAAVTALVIRLRGRGISLKRRWTADPEPVDHERAAATSNRPAA